MTASEQVIIGTRGIVCVDAAMKRSNDAHTASTESYQYFESIS